QDRLNVVISDSPIGAVDLSSIHAGNNNGYQAEWTIANLPEDNALDSVNLILLTDVDSGAIGSGQYQTLTDWIASGGHLIVTGGQNWQATAAGVADLLPLTPSGSREIGGLQPLADWLRADADLSAQTVVATGTLTADAQVFAAAADGTPLLVRRTYGAGVIDYLTADPNNAPLRGWDGLRDLWFTLVTTSSPNPGWANGFVDWEAAARATEILPGYDPLPDILPLFAFLGLYIALVGPANYLLLNRINRREWAWVTIPALILVFSVLSYVLGFNLRGNEVTLNRLAVVHSWEDSERARVDELIGLLSPRRSQYTLSSDDNISLRPIPRPLQASGILARNTQASVDIRESAQFEAKDFNVDASFVAGFHLNGMIDKPAISGQASIADDLIDGQQTVRGSVRNDSDMTLTDPVILARGIALHLEQPLAPGDVASFDLTLTGDSPPAPVLRTPVSTNSFFNFRTNANTAKQSVIDILGTDRFAQNLNRIPFSDSAAQQADRRSQYFLTSFIDDYYGTSGRGDRVYFAGWTDSTPLTIDMTGAAWNSQDMTLYLVELHNERVAPMSGSVTIAPDQFTWVVQEYLGLTDISPINVQMQPGEQVIFRFTPLPDAVLGQVQALNIVASNISTAGRDMPVYLWNWQTHDWESVDLSDEQVVVNDPQRFLGPQNAVQVRLLADDIGGYVRVTRIGVTQTGTF
ncbi:MAG: hypothetical protein IT319_01045, partial [Anaerolineae bacterium]|nr:hypothetical protein [Anaerolineae bacterium]